MSKHISMKSIFSLLFFSIFLVSCAQSTGANDSHKFDTSVLNTDSLQVAYFASGCFWCVEAVFESVEGVHEAISGYAGGEELNPTYESVSSGRSGHAESVQVFYDSSIVSYATLVDVFFNSHDPTTLNRQGPDAGTQYRSAIFYQNEEEKKIAEAKIDALLKNKVFSRITTELSELETFYPAEDYHQDYERLHPNQGYVKAVSIPRLNKFKEKMPEVLKESARLEH